MSAFDKLERKFSKGRQINLMVILIICQVIGFLFYYIYPYFLNYILFDPYLILHKAQIWRLFTFVFYPDSTSIFMMLITCFIYFSISRAVEMTVGRFRLNFFLASGLLLEVLFGFLFYLVMPYPYKNDVVYLTPYYQYAMLFVLFALQYPDARFLLMFIIPIRGKWMIFITMALYLLDIMRLFLNGLFGQGWLLVFMIASAVLNVVLFLLLSGYKFGNHSKTARNYRSAYNAYGNAGASRMRGNTDQNRNNAGRTASSAPRHKCAVCGRTSDSNPELEFRYCTRCIGNYEYCMEHLYTHTHVGPGKGQDQ